MNINVIKDAVESHITGGEYTILTAEIHIDPTLDITEQEALVIHAIIESFNRNWHHDTVDELTDLIVQGLIELRKMEE